MNHRLLLSPSAIALLLSTQLFAATYTLKPLEVTSTPLQQNELSATDAVEIYTQKDIEAAHVQNVYEFLNSQTSVFTTPSYGNPFSQKIDMHGYGIGDGYQNIVITLNGRRMNNVDMVPQLLASISPTSISRIEIIKSSGIVTGGDGANAGVINITTKQSSDKELALYAGNHGTYDGSFYLGHSDDLYSITAQGELYSTNGQRNIDSVGNTDEHDLKNGAINLSLTPGDAIEVSAGFLTSRVDTTYASFLTLYEYRDNPTQAGETNWGASQQKFDSNVYDLALAYNINEQSVFNLWASHEDKTSNYITYASISEYDYNSIRSSLDYESSTMLLTFGIDGFDGKRDGYGNKTGKKSAAAYLMSYFNLNNHTLKAGYRFENVTYSYNDSLQDLEDDSSLNGVEVGYNYQLDVHKSIFVNYAHAYQAPDIDRFFSSGGTFNGFIDPMTSDSITFGYNHISASNKFKVSAYYVSLDNEIYYYADPTYVNSVNTNIDSSHKYGFDLYDKFLVTPEFHVSLNYNYVKAVIDEEEQNGENYDGNELPGVPNHSAKIMLSYLPTASLTFSLMHTYRSDAYAANDFNNNFTQKQEATRSTDISATYTKSSYEFFAKINNLFDQSNGLWIQDDTIYPVNFSLSAIAGMKIKF
ncbi:MAG: TonB-dependent receptor [Campylobacterota bacterium]|nr:TonB-dependent receptor [Campylobacterota bacterium]